MSTKAATEVVTKTVGVDVANRKLSVPDGYADAIQFDASADCVLFFKNTEVFNRAVLQLTRGLNTAIPIIDNQQHTNVQIVPLDQMDPVANFVGQILSPTAMMKDKPPVLP